MGDERRGSPGGIAAHLSASPRATYYASSRSTSAETGKSKESGNDVKLPRIHQVKTDQCVGQQTDRNNRGVFEQNINRVLTYE